MNPLIQQISQLSYRVIPSGGTTGQALIKLSDTDYDITWSNVSSEGGAETDPIFSTSPAYGITSGNVSNWNTAYSWGNHASAGYITSESDPIFVDSDVYSVTSSDISNWDTAYGWGDHSTEGYLTIESDPIFVASTAYTITSTNVTNWNTAYTNNHTHTNKTLLDSLTAAGSGTNALFDDGTYKTVSLIIGGSDSYIQYNDSGVLGGDIEFTFNDTTKTLIVTNAYITQLDFNSTPSTTYIYEDGSGNISFVDAVSGEYTLADLIGGATNYWSTTTGGIYYSTGSDKVGIGTSTLGSEILTISGNIEATDFNSSYLRYTTGTNLLLGPNAGDNETGSDKLYIHNTNTAYPLVYGEFTNALLQFNADVYIAGTKTLNFVNSNVRIYRTSDQLAFVDTVANSGSQILLTELIDGTFNVLASDFTDLPAVLTITAANKSQWNTAYSLSHSHIDGILDWNGTTSVYEPYSSQQTALVSFDTSATTPVLTTRLNANCNLYTTNLYSGLISYNELDWTGGNVIYVPLSGDIQTYITNATAGDTLVLASGVYTITSTLTIDKQLNIVGQGRSGFVTSPVTPSHGTLISSSTASIVGFMLTNDNIRLSDLSINLTGDDSVAVQSSANLQGIVFNDIDIIVDCIGVARGFYLENTDTILRDITFYITSSDGIATGIYIHNNGSATKDSVVDAFNVTGIVQGATTYAYALACWNNNTAYTITLNLYNSVCTALAGTALDVGIASFSQTTSNSIVNAYMCTIDGQDYDVYQNNSNELNIGGSVIVHDSIFGTITYRTRVTADNLTTNVIKTSGTTQTAGYFDTGSSAPTDYADRLNYSGNFYSTNLFVTNKLTVGGLIDPTGLQLTPTGSNPGDSNTLWSNSGDSNKLYYGASIASAEYTFSNGLTESGGTVGLGGETNDSITINTNLLYDFSITGDGATYTNGFYLDGLGAVTIGDFTGANPQFYCDNTEVLMQLTGTAQLTIDSSGIKFADDAGLGGVKYVNDYSTNYTDRSLVDKGYVDSVISGVTPADNILDWDSGNNWYAPYSAAGTAGTFNSSSTDPIYTTRLNYEGYFYAKDLRATERLYAGGGSGLTSVTALATNGICYVGTVSGSTTSTNSMIVLSRQISGTADTTGDIINITDNPTTSGTISGKILSATIVSTERISLNPRVADGSTAVAYLFDTHTTLTNGTSKLFSICNAGSEKISFGYSGKINAANTITGTGDSGSNGVVGITTFGYGVSGNATSGNAFYGSSNTGVTAILNAGSGNTENIIDFKVNTVLKSYVTYTGRYGFASGTSTTYAISPGILKDFYTDASTSSTDETDLYSYTLPANVLASDGDKLVFEFSLDTDDSYNNTVKFYFGSTTLTMLNVSAGSAYNLNLRVNLIRVSSSVCRIFITGLTAADALMYTLGNNYAEFTSQDFTTTNVVKITGQVSAGTATARCGYIEYKPAGVN